MNETDEQREAKIRNRVATMPIPASAVDFLLGLLDAERLKREEAEGELNEANHELRERRAADEIENMESIEDQDDHDVDLWGV